MGKNNGVNGRRLPASGKATESQQTPRTVNNGRHQADDPHAAPQTNPSNGTLTKTPLSDQDLQHYRAMLLEKRRELLGDVSHMEDEALRRTRSDASGDLSMMPIHMADIGTDNYEQEFTIGLIAGERDTLKEIDAALRRIDDRTYGVCLATHQPISKARLSIKPWASYCVEYERAHETNGRRPH